MKKPTIEAVTWATLTGAVISACSLAAGDAGLPDHRLVLPTGSAGPHAVSSREPRPVQAAGAVPRRPHEVPPRPHRAPQQPNRSEATRSAFAQAAGHRLDPV